jgi:hypothetical protein
MAAVRIGTAVVVTASPNGALAARPAQPSGQQPRVRCPTLCLWFIRARHAIPIARHHHNPIVIVDPSGISCPMSAHNHLPMLVLVLLSLHRASLPSMMIWLLGSVGETGGQLWRGGKQQQRRQQHEQRRQAGGAPQQRSLLLCLH